MLTLAYSQVIGRSKYRSSFAKFPISKTSTRENLPLTLPPPRFPLRTLFHGQTIDSAVAMAPITSSSLSKSARFTLPRRASLHRSSYHQWQHNHIETTLPHHSNTISSRAFIPSTIYSKTREEGDKSGTRECVGSPRWSETRP